MPKIAYLECSRCHAHVSAELPQTVCPVCPVQPAGSLYVRYDLSHLRGTPPQAVIAAEAASSPWTGMWRYRQVLPDAQPVTLGEGWTPLLQSKRHTGALLKEEGANPTGTFKAIPESGMNHWEICQLNPDGEGECARGQQPERPRASSNAATKNATWCAMLRISLIQP